MTPRRPRCHARRVKSLKLIMNEVQWALAQSVLQQAGIRFTIVGEQFASLYPGPGVGAFQKQLLVADEDVDEAKALLHAFVQDVPTTSETDT